jgi:hypothetical protein
MQSDDLVMKFEKHYSLVSFLSSKTSMRSAWFLDNGESFHMIEAHDIFSSLKESDLDAHVDLGDDARYAVKGEGKITF